MKKQICLMNIIILVFFAHAMQEDNQNTSLTMALRKAFVQCLTEKQPACWRQNNNTARYKVIIINQKNPWYQLFYENKKNTNFVYYKDKNV